jgi:hypothetical protein
MYFRERERERVKEEKNSFPTIMSYFELLRYKIFL